MSPSPVSSALLRTTLIIAGLLGASGIVLGAFTAHGLTQWLIDQGWEDIAQKRVGQADVGVRYQLVHAVAILALVGASHLFTATQFRVVVGLMTLGTILFSGSLYLLVALNMASLGAITPIGGLIWIVAWSMLVLTKLRVQTH